MQGEVFTLALMKQACIGSLVYALCMWSWWKSAFSEDLPALAGVEGVGVNPMSHEALPMALNTVLNRLQYWLSVPTF